MLRIHHQKVGCTQHIGPQSSPKLRVDQCVQQQMLPPKTKSVRLPLPLLLMKRAEHSMSGNTPKALQSPLDTKIRRDQSCHIVEVGRTEHPAPTTKQIQTEDSVRDHNTRSRPNIWYKPIKVQRFTSSSAIKNETLGRIDAPTQRETNTLGYSASGSKKAKNNPELGRTNKNAGTKGLSDNQRSDENLDESVCLSLRNIEAPSSNPKSKWPVVSKFTASMEFKRQSFCKLAQPAGDAEAPAHFDAFGLLESRNSLSSELGSKATIPGLLSLTSLKAASPVSPVPDIDSIQQEPTKKERIASKPRRKVLLSFDSANLS